MFLRTQQIANYCPFSFGTPVLAEVCQPIPFSQQKVILFERQALSNTFLIPVLSTFVGIDMLQNGSSESSWAVFHWKSSSFQCLIPTDFRRLGNISKCDTNQQMKALEWISWTWRQSYSSDGWKIILGLQARNRTTANSRSPEL